MLGSITPLGERGRGARWGVTASWFAAGSVAGGLLLGWALGEAGVLALDGTGARSRLLALAVLAGAGLASDLGLGRPPSIRRQVDETWLNRYRGWVYGGGFGLQLGLGLATIVTSSAVYAAFAAAALSGSAGTGAAIGAAFGAARAATLLPARRVRSPVALVAVDAGLRRLERPVARAALLAHGAVVVAVLLVAG